MSDRGLTDRVLQRQQWIIGACMLLIVALAWSWLLRNGSWGLAPKADPMATMPGMAGMQMSGVMDGQPAAQSGGYLFSTFMMWFLMMTAMMLPSAAPMILLYARVAQNAKAQSLKAGGRSALVPTFLFAGVYLTIWAAFSLVAALAQTLLVRSGAVSAVGLALGDGRIAGALLIAAGLYQLTPLKRTCLDACRSPLSFVTRYWRPDWQGAVLLGLRHGVYCLGCCWLLMGLLFVGGVMSLVWVAALAIVVLIEKIAPFGRQAGLVAGTLAALAGAALVAGLRWPL